MNKILLKICFLALVCYSTNSAFAQDARYSQYYNNHPYLNPALTGNGIEYIRVTAIYRNQWAGFGTPFITQGFSIDKAVNIVGIGATVTRNGAGDASVKTLNLTGNLSYNYALGNKGLNIISAGVQVGIINKSFDPSKLTFDNQYNPDQGYDPNQSSGEVFSSTSITRPDVNAGLMWQRGWMKKDVKFKPFAGIAFSHITRPVTTFIDDDSRMPVKQSVYAGAGYLLNPRTEIRPSVMNLSQGTFGETTFGATMNYQLDNANTVQLGVYNRTNDAIIAYAGYQMNQVFVGMSYDVNTGELSKTGKGTNAFELSLTYSPRPRKKKEKQILSDEQMRSEKVPPAVLIPVSEIPNTTDQNIALKPAAVVETKTLVTAREEAKPIIEKAAQPEPAAKPIAASNTELTTKKPSDKQVTDANNTAAIKKTHVKVSDEKAPEVKTPQVTPLAEAVPVKTKSAEPKVTDSDNDGIPDANDKCPFIKGGAKSGGCPDSDSDGIIDMDDDCPMEAGPSTNNGCPDPNKPVVASNQVLVKNFNHILFETGSTRLSTDDIFDIIERAIDLLYADKTTSVLLSGHTDSEGNEFMNMGLSQARADVVKGYLLKWGIEEHRIQTVAYGETMHLLDNSTEYNRKQNRRVELNIIRTK